MDQVKKCPQCSRTLTYVKDVPFEAHDQGAEIAVRLASSIYQCPDHGPWRIFISGKVVPYEE
jgi:hypothetical protein